MNWRLVAFDAVSGLVRDDFLNIVGARRSHDTDDAGTLIRTLRLTTKVLTLSPCLALSLCQTMASDVRHFVLDLCRAKHWQDVFEQYFAKYTGRCC